MIDTFRAAVAIDTFRAAVAIDTFRAAVAKATGTPGLYLGDGTTEVPIDISNDASLRNSAVIWRADGPKSGHIFISPHLSQPQQIEYVGARLGLTWALLAAYHGAGAPRTGEVTINLDDGPVHAGLAFCARNADSVLIPDAIFIHSRAYADTRERLAAGGPPWGMRNPIALWRGATTGRSGNAGWRALPRIRLCGLSVAHPNLIDAGITTLVHGAASAEVAAEIRQAGYMRDFLPPHAFAMCRYQIDIDGNSNAWASLFQKLLTGSAVLKVASELGWRQWYYDRLEPWVNFVPVASDMSDLLEKISWLVAHDQEAAAIGAAGRRLALSMTYEAEIAAAIPVIAAAMKK
jgi:hypothetical protein